MIKLVNQNKSLSFKFLGDLYSFDVEEWKYGVKIAL
jgi:hypothetical protein